MLGECLDITDVDPGFARQSVHPGVVIQMNLQVCLSLHGLISNLVYYPAGKAFPRGMCIPRHLGLDKLI